MARKRGRGGHNKGLQTDEIRGMRKAPSVEDQSVIVSTVKPPMQSPTKASEAIAETRKPTTKIASHQDEADDAPQNSLAQLRARHALAAIQQIADESHSWESNYLAYVKALPATIIMAGLGQAMAMEKAGSGKSGDVAEGHEALFKHMQAWLCNADNKGWKTSPYRGKKDLLDTIVKGNEQEYIQAQGEAMAYLEWLKKFAAAYLVGEEDAGLGGVG